MDRATGDVAAAAAGRRAAGKADTAGAGATGAPMPVTAPQRRTLSTSSRQRRTSSLVSEDLTTKSSADQVR